MATSITECTNCGKTLPDNFKFPLCKECRKYAIKLLIGGGAALAVGGVAAYGIGKLADSNNSMTIEPFEGKNIPKSQKLSPEVYTQIMDKFSIEDAEWAWNNVAKGQWTEEHVISHFLTPKKEYIGYKPACCRGCNPAYPDCRSSCNIFDD